MDHTPVGVEMTTPGAGRSASALPAPPPDSIVRRICSNDACQRLAYAVEQIADGVCITDTGGVIEYVNDSFGRLMGFSREQMIGRKTSLFQSGEHDGEFYALLWNTVLAGGVFRRTFVNRKGDGAIVHLDESITPLRNAEGAITHFVAVARDITAQVRGAEILRRVNDHLEQQARSLAQSLHDEAGQLLTAAHIALADTGRSLPEPARARVQEVRQHLDLIEEELRRLSHELRPRVLDDLGLLPAVESLADGIERRHRIQVSVYAPDIGRLCPAVETAVYRAVQEALNNVVRHSRATRVTVAMARAPQALRCSIRDDGTGFDLAAVHALDGQAGIGLHGMRDRIEALGGTLRIRTAPGEGTELHLAVPLET